MAEKITFQLMGGVGCVGGKCPAIYLGSDGKYYVQGATVSSDVRASIGVAAGEDVVCVPAELIQGKMESR
jgi:hypothetical protein